MNNRDRELLANALAVTKPQGLNMRRRADQELYRVWKKVVDEIGYSVFSIHPNHCEPHPFYDACNAPPNPRIWTLYGPEPLPDNYVLQPGFEP